MKGMLFAMTLPAVFLGFLWMVSVEAGLDMGACVRQDGRGCSFKVWAPHASSVEVDLRKASAKGERTSFALQRGDENIWFGESKDAVAGDDYRYAVQVTHPCCGSLRMYSSF